MELRKSYARSFKFDSSILVEAYVEGRELTVSILGDDVFHPIHIKPSGDFMISILNIIIKIRNI